MRARDRLARPQPLQVEVLDDSGVGEDANVDDNLVALLVGIDVVKGKAGVGLEWPGVCTGAPVKEMKPRAQLRLVLVVLDVRAAAGGQPQRVDDERELGQDQPALT